MKNIGIFNNTMGELLPFSLLVKIFLILMGKCPFTLTKVNNETVLSYSYTKLLCCILHLVGLITMVTWGLVTYSWPEPKGLIVAAQILNLVIWYLGSVFISVATCLCLKKQLQLYQNISNVYYDVTVDCHPNEKENQEYKILVISGIVFVYTAGYIVLSLINFWRFGLFLAIPYTWGNLEYLVTCLEIYCFQFTICDIIKKFTNMLTCENVHIVKKLYLSLAQVNSDFNRIYWLQLIVLTISAAVGFVYDAFETGRAYISQSDEDSMSYYIFIQLYLLILIILSSVGSKKSDRANILLLKARTLLDDCTGSYKEDFEFLISSITDLPMNLSAAVFDVDYPFLTTILGFIITYVILLLEFHGGDSKG